ncbi:MurR/RpiR family transcriptional regulator [Xylocopilactobacillus apis]|uniref:Transcriptional regulator n=1 Tax=Xylocopilactobacillus apis TaxID=2932183 RepID=A0AAU9D0H5_9LACO|nr:MurR/RpiR family transcriptional regulator [Xylocopilactobacillus apis]BDR57144.1 transcriptional regulator [Xylocopilactobacillus apis]
MSVKGNIESVKNDLTDQELKIANYVLENPNLILEMNVQQLSNAAGTSAATVSRFVKSLNFSGYNELKLQLSADLSNRDIDKALYSDIKANESLSVIKEKLLNNSKRSLEETVAQINDHEVNQIVSLIHQSKQILLFGVGASFLTAKNIGQKWTRIGYACVVSDDLNQLLPLIVTSKKSDHDSVLWVISNSGESPEVILAAKFAKEAGVTVITTTKLGANTLNSLGDFNIQTSQPMEADFRIAATQSLHTQFMLVDIIYYSFVSKYYEQSNERLKKSRKVIQKYKKAMRKGF